MRRKELLKLIAGFRRFHGRYFAGEHSIYRDKLSRGQTPKTLLIGCSDSRVDPAILTSASPGELFIVRNVANLVPPFEQHGGRHGISAAIEFAVVNLKVENVVVLGHRQCGGIRALMSGHDDPNSFIGRWMGIAAAAKRKVLADYPSADVEELCLHCEREAIRVSLANLRSFPFVQEAVTQRNLIVVGVFFDLEEGKVLYLDEDTDQFVQLDLVPET